MGETKNIFQTQSVTLCKIYLDVFCEVKIEERKLNA